MNISTSPSLITRLPIRYDNDFGVTYIDEDRNGELALDELRTTEPTFGSDSTYSFELPDLKKMAREQGLEQLTEEILGSVSLESKEREYEGGEDYQFTTIDTLQEYVERQNRDGSSTSWTINPMLDSPNEMELLVWNIGPSKPTEPPSLGIDSAPIAIPSTPAPKKEGRGLRPETVERLRRILQPSLPTSTPK